MTKMSGTTPRPWVKLWRDERGSFAQLPLFARALAAEILKLCNADGCIDIGAREPADALAFALGATRGDRRLLKQFVPMLIADGYIRIEGERIVICAWSKWQTKPGAEVAPAATTEQRSDHESTTTEQRPSNEVAPKCAESLGRISQEGEGEGELDLNTAREGSGPTPPSPVPAPVAGPPRLTAHKLHAVYVQRRRKALPLVALPRKGPAAEGGMWDPHWEHLLAQIAAQARAEAATVADVAGRLYDGAFADEWARGKGFPPSMLLSKFAEYVQARPKTTGHVRSTAYEVELLTQPREGAMGELLRIRERAMAKAEAS